MSHCAGASRGTGRPREGDKGEGDKQQSHGDEAELGDKRGKKTWPRKRRCSRVLLCSDGDGSPERKSEGASAPEDGDCSGKLLDKARRRGDKRAAREKKTVALERKKHHAKMVVTTVTGKEGTREAAASCLVISPYILEAERVDGSTKGAKVMRE